MITQEGSSVNHTLAVMPHRVMEPYVKATNGVLVPVSSVVGAGGEYTLVPSSEYNRGGGMLVPTSQQSRLGKKLSKMNARSTRDFASFPD
jgi:hypothetical protein